MTSLNLLPPNRKEALMRQQWLALIRSAALALATSFAIVVGVLAAANAFLDQELTVEKKNVEQTKVFLGTGRQVTIDQTIRTFNTKVSYLNAVQTASHPWSPTLESFFNALPDGVQLREVTFDEKTGTLVIAGNATTRDVFLTATERIKQLPWVSNLVEPLITRRADISFSLTIGIDPKKFP